MKEIELTRGFKAMVDDEDFEFLSKLRWHAQKIGKNWYATRSTYIDKKNGSVYMHRQVVNAAPGILVDHKDGNGLNCQKHNLRQCNRQQNAFNTKDVDGNLPYKGAMRIKRVSRNGKVTYPIVAKIKKDGKSIWIGTYKTPEEAAAAYDNKALELFGEFASLNFPDKKHCGIINNRIRDSFPSPI